MAAFETQALELLRRKGARVLTFAQIADALAVGDPHLEELREALERLERQGAVARVRGEKYSAIEYSGLVSGKITIRAEGYGFVVSPESPGADLFIPPGRLGGALDGDLVLAREEARRAPRRGPRRAEERTSGTVLKVLRRARETLVGQFDENAGKPVVHPYDPRMATEVRIPPDATEGARDREIVVARFVSFPDERRVARGEVVERLGFLGEPGVDVEVVIRQFDLPHRFPREVDEEAATYPPHPTPEEIASRENFRDRPVITIDGETARDFDDAIDVERDDGGWRLWVHIADVSHYVREGTALDAEGRWRATSVYFPGRVVPMLPEHLSNGLCSLNPRVDRLTLSAVIELDRHGRTLSTRFVKGVIRSVARMTYTEVARLLGEPTREDAHRYGNLLDRFAAMKELALLLRERRADRGAIDFDLPNAAVTLDDEGYVTAIRPEARTVAHTVIEEFMLAANEAVAKHLLFAREPAVYRVHDRPDPDRLTETRETLAAFGYELKGDLAEIAPEQFQRVLRELSGKPEERFLTELLLRAQQKAVYAAECRGHYALAAPYYCHFTSPIRRYPDLLVHRALSRLIRERRPFSPADFETQTALLDEMARECSERERRAESAERESLQWKKIVYLRDKVGREFSAYVSGVVPFGLFVMLADFMVEGLVPVATLTDDFYVYEEKAHRLRGRSGGAIYRLGDAIRVVLASVDEVERRANFRLAGLPEKAPRRPAPARPAPRPHPVRPERRPARRRRR